MKKITVGDNSIYKDTEHLVLQITGDAVLINFTRQIDDLLIATPDGDLLISWDLAHDSEFSENACLLISPKDNLKEIGNLKATLLAVRAKNPNETLKVYLTAQRN